MKVLVTTIGYLLLVDLTTHEVKIVEDHRTEYYGISWWENCKFLVLSHSGLDNNTLINLETYATSEKGYLSYDNKETSPFLSQPHQILCAPNNIIITTNTGRNCITLFDAKSGFHKNIRINDIYWDRLDLQNACGEHFNSIFLKNNRLYVLAHRFRKMSKIYIFSYPECHLLEECEIGGMTGLHNIWVDNAGNMISCNSEAGSLIEIKTKEILWCDSSFCYTRGLAVTSDHIILGESQGTARKSREYTLSQLWILDRKNYNTIDYLPLGQYGDVHEVRCINLPDEAHHNIIYSGLDYLEQKINDRLEKLKQLQQNKLKQNLYVNLHNNLLKKYNCIFGCLSVNDDGWIGTTKDTLTLALFEAQQENNFSVSFEYSFLSQAFDTQHISFVIGYKGPADSNMVAILIKRNVDPNANTVSLWINENGKWERKSTIHVNIPDCGTMSIMLNKKNLSVSCLNLPTIIIPYELKFNNGAIGLRLYNAQFKNFSLENILVSSTLNDAVKTF